MQSHDTFEALLMKAVDGAMSQAEREALDEHLASCPECKAELEDFQRIKQSTDALGQRIMRDARIIPPRETRTVRGLVWAATALFVAGILLSLGYSGYLLLSDEEIPTIMKVSLSLLAGGAVLLAGLSIYQRARGVGRDPYEEIDI